MSGWTQNEWTQFLANTPYFSENLELWLETVEEFGSVNVLYIVGAAHLAGDFRHEHGVALDHGVVANRSKHKNIKYKNKNS